MSPSIALVPSLVVEGERVQVTGIGFNARRAGTLTYPGGVKDVRTDRKGRLDVRFRAGEHGGLVTATVGFAVAEAPLVVVGDTPEPPDPPEPPGPGGDRFLTGDVEFPAGYEVPAGATWTWDPDHSTTVTVRGNVIVRGIQRRRPARADVVHRLRFVGVDESKFVGGGMDPIDTDIGIWTVGDGFRDECGTPKAGWVRLDVGLARGSVELPVQPDGWQVGDRVVVAPTAPGDLIPEERILAASTTSGWRLDAPLTREHPLVTIGDRQFGPEVANLTRNVLTEGTPSGRAHAFTRSTVAPHECHTAYRWMGPRKNDPTKNEVTSPILGRWVVHYHHMHHATPAEDHDAHDHDALGGLVDAVVVEDCGSHAFVPHVSHGITFRDCVAYDNMEIPYWWDPPDKGTVPGDLGFNETDGNRWEHCLALATRRERARDGDLQGEVYGFRFAQGAGNVLTDCAVAGSIGDASSGGAFWPGGKEAGEGWAIVGLVAHNNMGRGLYAWSNGSVQDFTDVDTYHNTREGVVAGSYKNVDRYLGGTSGFNGGQPFSLNAACDPPKDSTRVFEIVDYTIDATGSPRPPGSSAPGPVCIDVAGGNAPFEAPTVVRDCTLLGGVGIRMARTDPTKPAIFDVEDCTFGGVEFWFEADCAPGNEIRYEGQVLRPVRVAGGRFEPRWNCKVFPA